LNSESPELRVKKISKLRMAFVSNQTRRLLNIREARSALPDRMMAGARRGRFDIVLVWACDRLARSARRSLETMPCVRIVHFACKHT
jgi:DNA invertase Pin-like site-specific DNA recombinase